jgi:hypothetical protein
MSPSQRVAEAGDSVDLIALVERVSNMVTKNNKRDENAETKSRVKVGKLRPNKQTIKELTPIKQKQVKGGRGLYGAIEWTYTKQKADGTN